MAWTYGPITYPPPASLSDLDQVRLLIGDIDPDAPLLQDEEIGLYLTGGLQAQPNLLLAGAMAAALISGKFRRLVDVREGAASANLSQLAKQYSDLAAELRDRSAVSGASGILAAPAAQSARTCGPAFTRALGDAWGAGDWPR